MTSTTHIVRPQGLCIMANTLVPSAFSTSVVWKTANINVTVTNTASSTATATFTKTLTRTAFTTATATATATKTVAGHTSFPTAVYDRLVQVAQAPGQQIPLGMIQWAIGFFVLGGGLGLAGSYICGRRKALGQASALAPVSLPVPESGDQRTEANWWTAAPEVLSRLGSAVAQDEELRQGVEAAYSAIVQADTPAAQTNTPPEADQDEEMEDAPEQPPSDPRTTHRSNRLPTIQTRTSATRAGIPPETDHDEQMADSQEQPPSDPHTTHRDRLPASGVVHSTPDSQSRGTPRKWVRVSAARERHEIRKAALRAMVEVHTPRLLSGGIPESIKIAKEGLPEVAATMAQYDKAVKAHAATTATTITTPKRKASALDEDEDPQGTATAQPSSVPAVWGGMRRLLTTCSPLVKRGLATLSTDRAKRRRVSPPPASPSSSSSSSRASSPLAPRAAITKRRASPPQPLPSADLRPQVRTHDSNNVPEFPPLAVPTVKRHLIDPPTQQTSPNAVSIPKTQNPATPDPVVQKLDFETGIPELLPTANPQWDVGTLHPDTPVQSTEVVPAEQRIKEDTKGKKQPRKRQQKKTASVSVAPEQKRKKTASVSAVPDQRERRTESVSIAPEQRRSPRKHNSKSLNVGDLSRESFSPNRG